MTDACPCTCHTEGEQVCYVCAHLHDLSAEACGARAGDHDLPYAFDHQPQNYMRMIDRIRLTALRSRICGARAGELDDRYGITIATDLSAAIPKE